MWFLSSTFWNKALTMKKIGCIGSLSLFSAALLAANEPTLSMQESLQELQRKVANLEQQQQAKKGVLELASTDTVLSLGGRIQLNVKYSSPNTSFFASKIAASDQEGSDAFTVNARDSRLWVKTRTPSDLGMIRTTLEIDFFGSSATNVSVNDHNPRLRHAYVQIGNFGFGQTNSAFNSIVAIETLNYAMDDTFVRQPVIRYTHNAGMLAWDFSIEEPDATFFTPTSTSLQKGKSDTIPDLILAMRYYPTWGELGLSCLSRVVRYEQSGTSDTQYGYGVNFSGRVKLFGLDDLRFNAHYGEGSGRYIAYNGFGAGVIDPNGDVELTEIVSGHLGYRHWWSEKLRSTLALSYIGGDTATEHMSDFSNVTKESYSVQANLLFNPVKNIMTGLEYIYAKREFEDKREGDAQGVNFIFRFDF